MISLRNYQLDILDRARDAMRRGVRNFIVCAPTGSGKTALTVAMLGAAAERGKQCWFVVHRRELLQQSSAAFAEQGIDCGVIQSGELPRPWVPIQVASVQTLARRLDLLQPPDLLIIDECHHCVAGQFDSVYRACPDAYRIGLSATPARLDGQGLGGHFSEIIIGPSVRELIDAGYLSDYTVYAPSCPDLAGIRRIAGDYDKHALADAMDKPSITGSAVAEYQSKCPGSQAIAFCVSIQHSQSTTESFCAAGVSAAHLDGTMSSNARDAIMDDFRSRRVQVIANCDLFGEGLDVPGIEAAILLRPTQSLGLFLQQVGRALRPAPGKQRAIILDHAGNCYRHGLPDDEREWSLEGKKRAKRSEQTESVKLCKKCFAANRVGMSACAYCGTPFQVVPREIEEISGKLSEVDRTAMRTIREREQARAQVYAQLVELGRQRGYKNPRGWAYYVMKSRSKKKFARSEPGHNVAE